MKTAEQIARIVIVKLAEIGALPLAQQHQLRDALTKQRTVFGEGALMRSAPSSELEAVLQRIQPSTGDRVLYGAGGALGGAALMGGAGALMAALRQGNRAAALKGGLIGAGTGALSGALAGQHYLQRRRIGDAIREAYGD